MKLKDVIEGLQIIQKAVGPDAQTLRAEHDILWAGDPSRDAEKLSAEDLARLEALGWRIDGDADGWRVLI